MLFFVPALAAQRLYTLYQEQRQLTDNLTDANSNSSAQISRSPLRWSPLSMRATSYTAGHSAAVAIYSRDIAQGWASMKASNRRSHLAGLVHDIGKIGLPPGLLEKDGPLRSKSVGSCRATRKLESASLQRRYYGGSLTSSAIITSAWMELDIRMALKEAEIPLLSRIIAVADAYNAMTSDRPYREAMPSRVARMRLAQAVGSQFDTSVVAAFEAILAMADEAYRHATSADFDFFADEPRGGESAVSLLPSSPSQGDLAAPP